MRYERKQVIDASHRPRFSRRAQALIGAGILVVVGAVSAIVVANSHNYAVVTGSPRDIAATKAAFRDANVLTENLGALAPSGVGARTWLLTSHPIGADHASVAAEMRPWVGPAGVAALTSADASEALAQQTAVIESVAGGAARTLFVGELRQLIHAQVGAHPHIAGPGGASIVQWLRVHVEGDVANLEAYVNVWESHPRIDRSNGTPVLRQTLDANELDVTATLHRSHSGWRVTDFNQAPWQEAT